MCKCVSVSKTLVNAHGAVNSIIRVVHHVRHNWVNGFQLTDGRDRRSCRKVWHTNQRVGWLSNALTYSQDSVIPMIETNDSRIAVSCLQPEAVITKVITLLTPCPLGQATQQSRLDSEHVWQTLQVTAHVRLNHLCEKCPPSYVLKIEFLELRLAVIAN